MTLFGKIELSKSHRLQGTKTFSISPKMQETICYLGQSITYGECEEIIQKTLNVSVSSMQCQRVSTYYGEQLNTLIESGCEAVLKELPVSSKTEATYIMMDGTMLFTNKNEWKELKLGRIFNNSQVANIHNDRREILDSVYVSHLGQSKDFFKKLEPYVLSYTNRVIIGDGASWIWNWVEDNYPGATQILDFYHAKEKLVLFAKHHFVHDHKRKQWVKAQCTKLLDDGVLEVIESLKSIKTRNEKSKELKAKAIMYYETHEDKMLYRTYKERGLMISSAPIESAHRSVVQQRMKLSGQKWSIRGANAIANLRCLNKSRAWNVVLDIVKADSL